MSDPRTPIWIDCDPGHDDAFALLLGAHHPHLHLLGVSTVSGNADVEHTTANARALLSALGRGQGKEVEADGVRVYRGAAEALRRKGDRRAGNFHGTTGLAGVNLPKIATTAQSTSTQDASLSTTYDAIRDAIFAQPKLTVWLVAIGPLTNITALLDRHPEVADWLAGLSIMGGAIGGGFANALLGKDGDSGEIVEFPSRWAEFNTWSDPEAAAAVYSNPMITAKTTLAPLDLTYQILAIPAIEEKLFCTNGIDGALSSIRQLFHEVLLHNKKSYQSYFPNLPGPPLHDILAVAVLLDSVGIDDGDGERWTIDMVLEGDQDGRTMMTLCEPGQQGVRIPRKLGEDAVWEAIEIALKAAEANES